MSGAQVAAAAGHAGGPDPGPEPVGVAVVDDDEWRRRGLVEGVRELGGELRVVGACTRGGSAGPALGGPDVVLVAADAAAAGWDRLVGLGTAGELRRRLGKGPTVVVLADDLCNPLLPVRAAEAGADYVYSLAEVDDLAALRTMLLAPSDQRRPAELVDLALLRTLGVSFSSRLTAGLALVEQGGLTGLFDDPPSLRLTRRRRITLRRTLATTMAVQPAGPVTAARNQSVRPSWQQLCRIVDLARGATVHHL